MPIDSTLSPTARRQQLTHWRSSYIVAFIIAMVSSGILLVVPNDKSFAIANIVVGCISVAAFILSLIYLYRTVLIMWHSNGKAWLCVVLSLLTVVSVVVFIVVLVQTSKSKLDAAFGDGTITVPAPPVTQ